MGHVVQIALGWIAVAGILAVVTLLVAVTIATIRNPSMPGNRDGSDRDIGDMTDQVT